MTRTAPGEIAVAIHDVEPATFERCALIRALAAGRRVLHLAGVEAPGFVAPG